MMNPPSILFDHSFLVAIHDPEDSNHDQAVAIYRSLIDDFVEQRCLLVARADHLSGVADPELFATVDKLHVARQHRNAATEVVARTGVDIDEAITLVLIRRTKIRKVATFDERFDAYDLDLVNTSHPSDYPSEYPSDGVGTSPTSSDAQG
jgi:predicted nucleic acid-binding protein